MSKPILILGATGNQGRAVIQAFLSSPAFSPELYTLYCVTRNPSSPSASSLASRSPAIQLVAGDINNVPAIFEALPAVAKPLWGVFSVQPRSKEPVEIAQGKAVVDEALNAGVQHFVYASVDRGGKEKSDETPTEVPHFRSKYEIEKYLLSAVAKSDRKITYTILRPVFFLDNLEGGFVGKVIATAWRDHLPANKKMQVIAASDIGFFGASAFLKYSNPQYRNQAISIAGDELTFDQANKIFQEETGQPIPTSYGFIASSLVNLVKGIRLMFKFMRNEGTGCDLETCKAMNPELKSMRAWAAGSSFAKNKQQG